MSSLERSPATSRAATLGLAFAGLLAACGGSSGSGAAPDATTTTTTSAALATVVATSALSGAGTTDGATTTPTTAAPTTPPPTTTATIPPAGDPGVVVGTLKTTVVAQLAKPIAMAFRTGDPTLYVAEQGGRVQAVRDGQRSVALDLSTRTRASGEQGLLGLAIGPDGQHAYVDFTDLNGDSHIEEYAIVGDGRIDANSRRDLLVQPQPYPNHNGGGLAFGPDKMLYISFGDGGSGNDPQNRAQNLGTWLGKLLRIDPKPNGSTPYTVPADNPFVGTGAAKPEIWAYGLRNPWRFSFDAATGDLWIGDVGQDHIEEVDWASAAQGGGRGVNYGWRRFEGDSVLHSETAAPGAVAPAFTMNHSTGVCAIVGGVVYRGSAVAAMRGLYVFTDNCLHTLMAWTPTAGVVDLKVAFGAPASVNSGPDGAVFVADLAGRLVRIDPA